MSMEGVDKQIKKLVKRCVKRNFRCLFIVLGLKGSDQVPIFIQLLKNERKIDEISCLWCTKEQPPSYDDIAHQSFDLAVLKDFDALSIQTLASVTDVVKGGGIILFLLQDLESLEDLIKINLNVKYKPSRFCKRFSSLLRSCPNSIILDENLSVLSHGGKFEENLDENSLMCTEKIEDIKLKHDSDAIYSNLLGVCHTPEQAQLLVKFLDVLKSKTLHSIASVSSAVGRGKSAALGLAIAGSLAFNYSNIFISSMSYINVKCVFKFLLMGLDALNYKEDKDFDLIESVNPKFNKALIGINVFRDHPQSIRFVLPLDISQKLEQAELVVFDEAASIPAQILKPLFGPYVILMASSISGLGSSSPYLYGSMINTIQQSFAHPHESDKFETFTLTEHINYSNGDCIESWMNNLLQIKPPMTSLLSCGFPIPDQCELFYVNRDVLFSGSSQAEAFLQSLMSVLSSSERVINPDQLLKFADSPNHDLFCLLPPFNNSTKRFTDVITVIVVHIENEIPENIVHCGTNLNESITHCFNEWKTGTMISQPKFLPVQGIHIENIVTHQSYRKMGYGMRAFQLLQDFYEGKCISLDENLDLKCKVADETSEQSMAVDSEPEAALLQQLTEVQPENIDYILVTCSLTSQSLRFWKKANFVPAFITDEINSEGDHVLFMVKGIKSFDEKLLKSWSCFQNHLCVLLGSVFKHFPASLALNLIHFNVDSTVENTTELTKECIDMFIRPHRMKSLMKYCQNLQDFHSALQFIPILSNLYFKLHFKDMSLSRVQEAILLSFGLQFKVADDVSKDLGLPNIQIHGLLNRSIKKLVKYLNDILEKSVEKSLENPEVVMEPITEDLNEELEEAAKKIQEQQDSDSKKLLDLDISQFAIKGSEDDWQKALFSGRKALVNIKSIKKTNDTAEKDSSSKQNFKKNKRPKKQRR